MKELNVNSEDKEFDDSQVEILLKLQSYYNRLLTLLNSLPNDLMTQPDTYTLNSSMCQVGRVYINLLNELGRSKKSRIQLSKLIKETEHIMDPITEHFITINKLYEDRENEYNKSSD